MADEEQITKRIDQLGANDQEDEASIQDMIEKIEELEDLLSPKAQEIINDLRPIAVTDDVYDELDAQASIGDRMADQLATFAGSWPFILGFALLMTVWISINLLLGKNAFDSYPFILLNLALSTLAALQAPVILMSQNRQADKDRAVARNDYEVNIKSELEIADLHRKIDMLQETLNQQNQQLVKIMTQQIKAGN
jgi:uncharacterized membrane protein